MLSSLILLISPQTFVDHFSVRVYFYGIHKLLVKNKQTNKQQTKLNVFGEKGWIEVV